MPVDQEHLTALAVEIGRFHITDRAMLQAQRRFSALLAAGQPPPQEVTAYVRAARRYFAGFDREARRHLDDVEKRLAKVSQVQFNLTAERGVAERRVEATQGVLSRLAEVESP
jgi:hypothetical protein